MRDDQRTESDLTCNKSTNVDEDTSVEGKKEEMGKYYLNLFINQRWILFSLIISKDIKNVKYRIRE